MITFVVPVVVSSCVVVCAAAFGFQVWRCKKQSHTEESTGQTDIHFESIMGADGTSTNSVHITVRTTGATAESTSVTHAKIGDRDVALSALNFGEAVDLDTHNPLAGLHLESSLSSRYNDTDDDSEHYSITGCNGSINVLPESHHDVPMLAMTHHNCDRPPTSVCSSPISDSSSLHSGHHVTHTALVQALSSVVDKFLNRTEAITPSPPESVKRTLIFTQAPEDTKRSGAIAPPPPENAKCRQEHVTLDIGLSGVVMTNKESDGETRDTI